MYVFRDYNKLHAKQILISFGAYAAILAIVSALTIWLRRPTAWFFSIALLGLLAAHLVRIFQLRSRPAIRMNASQNVVSAIAIIFFIPLAIGYGYASVSEVKELSAANYRVVVLPFVLASFISIWADFFVAQMFARLE
jgi:hypothetical protein